jgi:transposase-like protein
MVFACGTSLLSATMRPAVYWFLFSTNLFGRLCQAMSFQLHCPSCAQPLKVQDELAGQKVICPSCGAAVTVPAAEAEREVVEAAGVEVVAADKGRGDGSTWVACPKCGAAAAKRVKWTFWGSFYGPRLFNHVRCQECRATYNGKTGGSNIVPAVGCVLLPLLGIVLVLSTLGGYVYYVRYYLPEKQLREEEEEMRSPIPRLKNR